MERERPRGRWSRLPELSEAGPRRDGPQDAQRADRPQDAAMGLGHPSGAQDADRPQDAQGSDGPQDGPTRAADRPVASAVTTCRASS